MRWDLIADIRYHGWDDISWMRRDIMDEMGYHEWERDIMEEIRYHWWDEI